jgi:hypothetical protein
VEGSIIKLQGDGQETDGGTQLPHVFFYKKNKTGNDNKSDKTWKTGVICGFSYSKSYMR